MNEDKIKFLLILICFFISVFSCIRNKINKLEFKYKDDLILCLAMLFTVIADFNLLIEYNSFVGILVFIAVQIIHNYRFSGKKYFKILFIIIIIFTIIIIMFLIFKFIIYIKGVYLLTGIYAICFIFTIISVSNAFRLKKRVFPNNYICLIGIILFAICDLNVAIYNAGLNLTIISTEKLLMIIWMFYLPAQMLLSFSGWNFKSIKEKNNGARKRSDTG